MTTIKKEIVFDILFNLKWIDIKPFVESTLNQFYSKEDVIEMMKFANTNSDDTPLLMFIIETMKVGRVNMVLATMGFNEKERAEAKNEDLKDKIATFDEKYMKYKKIESLEAMRDS